MRYIFARVLIFAVVVASLAFAQNVPLNVTPSRIVGHPLAEQNASINSFNPNLVEGRELYLPEGIALDTSVSPPMIYVADTFNHRILAWQNSTGFSNGQPADLVIGQPDQYHTGPHGPGTTFSTGLNSPTGITVYNGDLYVADSQNNRILRFPKPFANKDNLFPDLWVGQPSLQSRTANYTGQIADKGLNLAGYTANMAFDSAGNMWVTDPGNRRVLRFDGADVANGGGPLQAKLVLGQQTFGGPLEPGVTSSTRTDTKHFAVPSAIAFDSSGRLYVSDADAGSKIGRVLVFDPKPAFTNFMAAARIMGVIPQGQTTPLDQQYKTLLGSPNGIFFIPSDSKIGIVDTGFSRIALFDSYEKWPDASVSFSPVATAIVGQPTISGSGPNGQTDVFVPAPTDSVFYFPYAATFGNGEMYVADTYNNRVLAMPYQPGGLNGGFPGSRAVLGQDGMDMNAPNLIEGREFYFDTLGGGNDAGVAVDTSGDTPHLYIADTYNNRILGFNDFRQVAAGMKADIVIGQADMQHGLCNGNGDPNHPSATSLCHPIGLLVDANGNLYVADTGNARVLRFPAPFAHQGLEKADLVLGQRSFTSRITDPSPSTMAAPYGIAFSGQDGLLVSDGVHNRVLFFRFNNGGFDSATDSGKAAEKVFGQPDFTTVTSGNGVNQMNSPRGVAADGEGRPYVADFNNNRVLIFDQINNDPNGASAVKSISIGQPLGIYINQGTGEAWITDPNNGLVKKYPKFQTLIASSTPTATASVQSAGATLAVTQDQYGDLIVADNTNRLGFYFPGLQTINGGNFISTYPLAPGMFASICAPSSNCNNGAALFGSTTTSANELPNPLPLPTTLGDVQVLFNGNPTPLYYVSPKQINFYVPMKAPTTGNAEVIVMQKSTGRIYAAGSAPMQPFSPAVLMADFTGVNRQALVLNADGSINSPTNPASRGSWISIYAVGQGFVDNAPPDGSPAPSSPLLTTGLTPQINIAGQYPEDYQRSPNDPPAGQFVNFSGLAPGFVGLWQINAYIPGLVTPATQVPLLIFMGSRPSNDFSQSGYRTTIAVK
jgi:uncharacterized protein (TIGR03437 family)